jgi:hypothetical protein
MSLNDAPSFSDVQSTIKYLRDRDVIVDDVKCFHQFCNLKTFVQSVWNDEDFKSASVHGKCVKYVQRSCNAVCHSELLKLTEFFLCILVVMPMLKEFFP